MGYGFWYDVAEYGNEAWKGNFTAREIAENAYDYKREWDATLSEHKVSKGLDDLLHILHEDYCNGSTKAIEMLDHIVDKLLEFHIKWFID